jgi:hypothetical protein
MAVVQMAILACLPYTDLRDAILAHPTMPEGVGSLFSNVPLSRRETTDHANADDRSSADRL